jgi:hypothetical protein
MNCKGHASSSGYFTLLASRNGGERRVLYLTMLANSDIMEHHCNDSNRGKLRYLEENLAQGFFFYHQSHMRSNPGLQQTPKKKKITKSYKQAKGMKLKPRKSHI